MVSNQRTKSTGEGVISYPIIALTLGVDSHLEQSRLDRQADSGKIDFVNQTGVRIEESIADLSPSIILSSAEEYLLRLSRIIERDKLSLPPILLCLTSDDLEREDLFEAVDDFMVVPCSAMEIEKRIVRLVLGCPTQPPQNTLSVGNVTLDEATYKATVDGVPQQLSWMEFQLLKLLMRNFGRVLTREQILAEVWDTEHFGGSRTVDVHISRLKFKLGPEASEHFRTVKNVGYGLV